MFSQRTAKKPQQQSRGQESRSSGQTGRGQLCVLWVQGSKTGLRSPSRESQSSWIMGDLLEQKLIPHFNFMFILSKRGGEGQRGKESSLLEPEGSCAVGQLGTAVDLLLSSVYLEDLFHGKLPPNRSGLLAPLGSVRQSQCHPSPPVSEPPKVSLYVPCPLKVTFSAPVLWVRFGILAWICGVLTSGFPALRHG